MCIAEGEILGNPRRVRKFTREQYFKPAAADGGAVRRRALGGGQHAGDRPALQPGAGPGQAAAARTSRRPNGMPIEEYFRIASHEGLEERLAQLYPDPAAAREGDAALRRAAGVRDRHHPEDGLPGLLPDRGRLHQLGQEQRLPGGAGPRLRRRLAGGLRAEDHRPRPAAVQPAVRALPEPGAGVDARLRHRLLPGQPRPRDRLRQGQVRARRGQPDRHLRHHGRARRDARRRPRAGHELHLLRRHQQADPQQAGHDGHAAVPAGAQARRRQDHLRAREGAGAGRAQPQGRGRAHAAGAGAEARGHDAQHRHARRRRADRAGQADRLLAAVPAARQRIGGEPVRQGRRRGHRPGEVRLPGPGHADHPGDRQGLHPRAPPGPGGLRLREGAAGRRGHLQAVRRRQDRGGVPVRIARHAGHAARRPADPAGGPDRAERAVPPGPDGPDPQLRGAQARARGGGVPAPAGGRHALRDLRDHGLPGAGDADGADPGRLHARRRRPAAPRHGQEEGRGDGPAPRALPRRCGQERHRRRTRPTRSST